VVSSYENWSLPRSKTLEKIKAVSEQTPIKLITMEYPPLRGGAGVYCEELAHASYELGLNIEVLAPKGSYSDSSVKLTPLPFKGSQGWGCSWKIIKFLKTHNLQKVALHIGDPGALRAIIRFGWTLPKPKKLIITIHGSEIPKFSSNPLEGNLFRNLLRKADKIHVLSKYNEEKLLQFCPDNKNRVQLIPGAPARDILPNSNPPETRDYTKKNLVLLCVGRIHPRKGQHGLLQVIEKLPSELKERLICRFVGPLKNKNYANKVLALSKKMDCDIQFLGDLKNKDLQEAYQNADIFALTSIPLAKSVEGFGFVYLEASAHGLPIVANRTGGVEDAVLNGQTGLLADPKNQSEVTEHLIALMEDKDLREAMGSAGIQWAAEHSWEKVAQALYQ
jgi:phosphatidylinositol alpha-1,6-mannosyltransferase